MLVPASTRSYGFEGTFKRRVFSATSGTWTTDVDDFTASSGSSVNVAPPVVRWASGTGANRLFYMAENFDFLTNQSGSQFDTYFGDTGGPARPIAVANSWDAPFFLSGSLMYSTAGNFDQNNLVGIMYGSPWAGGNPSAPFPSNPNEPFVFLGCRGDTDKYVLAWAKGDGSAVQRTDVSTAGGGPGNTNAFEVRYQPSGFIEAKVAGRTLGIVTTNLPVRNVPPTRGAGVFASSGGNAQSVQDGFFWALGATHILY